MAATPNWPPGPLARTAPVSPHPEAAGHKGSRRSCGATRGAAAPGSPERRFRKGPQPPTSPEASRRESRQGSHGPLGVSAINGHHAVHGARGGAWARATSPPEAFLFKGPFASGQIPEAHLRGSSVSPETRQLPSTTNLCVGTDVASGLTSLGAVLSSRSVPMHTQ